MLKPIPDLGLPPPVVALDSCLEAGLLRRSEDRYDTKTQAKAHHATDGVTMLVRSLEAGVVVELGIARQTRCTPMSNEIFHSTSSGDWAFARPGRHQASIDRDAVEYLNVNSATNNKAFD